MVGCMVYSARFVIRSLFMVGCMVYSAMICNQIAIYGWTVVYSAMICNQIAIYGIYSISLRTILHSIHWCIPYIFGVRRVSGQTDVLW